MEKNNNYFDNENISNSDLSLLEKSPKLFQQYKILKTKQFTETKQQKLGTLVHSYLLENASFWGKYKLIPNDLIKPVSQQENEFCNILIKVRKQTGYLSIKQEDYVDAYSKVYKEKSEKVIQNNSLEKFTKFKKYIELSAEDYKTPILKDTYDVVCEICKGIYVNPTARELLFRTNNATIFSEKEFYDEIIQDVKVKAKIDRIKITQPDMDVDKIVIDIIDFKTTSKNCISNILINNNNPYLNVYEGFLESFIKYDYLRQLAFYKLIISSWANKKYPGYEIEINCHCVASSTISPNQTMVYTIKPETLAYGVKKVFNLLEEYESQKELKEYEYPLKNQKGVSYV